MLPRELIKKIRRVYQGGTFPSPLTRHSRVSLPPPREDRASKPEMLLRAQIKNGWTCCRVS
jgi:hypothetical protein